MTGQASPDRLAKFLFFFGFWVQLLAPFKAYRSDFDFEIRYSRLLRTRYTVRKLNNCTWQYAEKIQNNPSISLINIMNAVPPHNSDYKISFQISMPNLQSGHVSCAILFGCRKVTRWGFTKSPGVIMMRVDICYSLQDLKDGFQVIHDHFDYHCLITAKASKIKGEIFLYL